MRTVIASRPFSGGMISDQPAHVLGPQQTTYAQDLLAPQGIATQRKGWVYDGTAADSILNNHGVIRNKFLLAAVTQTMTSTSTGTVYVHNASSTGTQIVSTMPTGGGTRLPRAVYRDHVIWCAQDGLTPIVLYSGAANGGSSIATTGTMTTAANAATLTTSGGSFSSLPLAGMYISNLWDNGGSVRIVEATSTGNVTLSDAKFSGATLVTGTASPIGRTTACVPIYNGGTATTTATTTTGIGTKWSTAGVTAGQDIVQFIPSTGNSTTAYIGAVGSNTSLTVSNTGGTYGSGTAYTILRPCPFKDVANHKGSLWGTGVSQYPNNVYVGPPGWNLAAPPGFDLPWDPLNANSSENANDFVMDQVAIPTAYDGDVNIAILSSPSPLLVLKRKAVHGIFGAYPNFTQDKIADGAGCIDIRSAISAPQGQFWAGEGGIYAYVNGQVIDLTDGRINREWRNLIKDFDFGVSDYCSIGQVYGHLVVSLVTGGGVTARTYVYDLVNQAWMSRFTNHKARYFFSSRVDGERDEIYWVGDSQQGRVMKSRVAFDGTGIAKDGDGTAPRLQAYTGQGIDGNGTIDSDERLLDVAISTNVYDSGAAGATQLTVSEVSGGSLEAQADVTTSVGTINSDSVDRIDRTRFSRVNSKGRLHQIRVDVPTLGTNSATTKVEIHEMSATFRTRRSRT